jgi:hypothetical protein
MQRRRARDVFGIYRCYVQGRHTVVDRGIHVGLVSQEQLHGALMAKSGAAYKGVAPLLSLTFTSALLANSSLTMSAWPALAATDKGVSPFLSLVETKSGLPF